MSINTNDLIYPYFVTAGSNIKEEIKSFPGVFRFSVDKLAKDVAEAKRLGINKILLFGVPSTKDALGKEAFKKNNIVAQALKGIKKEFPGLVVMTDVCLCAYTDHGHCGILKAQGHLPYRQAGKGTRTQVNIDSKKTLSVLAKIALSHADAGADWVAPSAMAKKQVLAIRKALDKNGFKNTKIMGYSAKFASGFYGPFRNAALSAPAFGDRSGYQLDYTSAERALNEISEDIKEGADMVMVKPALGYLDIVKEAKLKFNYPLAAYNVSGEYVFVKHGVKSGLWEEEKMVKEIILSIKRSGADFVITYHAKDIARWIKK